MAVLSSGFLDPAQSLELLPLEVREPQGVRGEVARQRSELREAGEGEAEFQVVHGVHGGIVQGNAGAVRSKLGRVLVGAALSLATLDVAGLNGSLNWRSAVYPCACAGRRSGPSTSGRGGHWRGRSLGQPGRLRARWGVRSGVAPERKP